jgi:hypothetical protein
VKEIKVLKRWKVTKGMRDADTKIISSRDRAYIKAHNHVMGYSLYNK